MYASHCHPTGTLFDERTSSWNINNLDNILNRIQITLPGVNTPYLYFGMWKATFAWHVEVDRILRTSIAYLIFCAFVPLVLNPRSIFQGHGSLFDQLLALWCAQTVVRYSHPPSPEI